MIIVEDAPNSLPAQVSALEEVILVMSHLNMPALTAVAVQYESNCQNAGGTAADCDENTWSEGATAGAQINTVLINGQFQPTISSAQHTRTCSDSALCLPNTRVCCAEGCPLLSAVILPSLLCPLCPPKHGISTYTAVAHSGYQSLVSLADGVRRGGCGARADAYRL